ncbi:MAG: hypothetical protein JW847_01610 [Candidatus Omnitrophica bacterium]|nr:hypothetical protein [Candidatus Omnitrophota bacterium]
MTKRSDWGTSEGMPSAIVAEVYERLERIKRLAKEIEDVPNLLPDLWSMKMIDKKCQEIQQNTIWINDQVHRFIGTGAG